MGYHGTTYTVYRGVHEHTCIVCMQNRWNGQELHVNATITNQMLIRTFLHNALWMYNVIGSVMHDCWQGVAVRELCVMRLYLTCPPEVGWSHDVRGEPRREEQGRGEGG